MELLASPEVSQAITNLVLTIITALAVVSLNGVRAFIQARTSETQFELLQEVATVAVQAVEQQPRLRSEFETKKARAYHVIQDTLKQAGIHVTADDIDAAIEAAVLREFSDDDAEAV